AGASSWRRPAFVCFSAVTSTVPPPRSSWFARQRAKPRLHDSWGDALRFNVSHSEGIALYAIERGVELGVDVERVQPAVVSELHAARRHAGRQRWSPPIPSRGRVTGRWRCGRSALAEPHAEIAGADRADDRVAIPRRFDLDPRAAEVRRAMRVVRRDLHQ